MNGGGCRDCGAVLDYRNISGRCASCRLAWVTRHRSHCTDCGAAMAECTIMERCAECIAAVAQAEVARMPGRNAPAALYPARAVDVVSDALAVPPAMLTGPRRDRSLVRGRWAVIVAMRRRGYSMPRIGARVGRDHASVCYALRVYEDMAARDPMLRALIALAEAA